MEELKCTNQQLQDCMLGVMKYIDKVCRENGLEYALAYGSLIGAVRHHGFIPWDDDMDIWLKRDDYEKLIDIIMKEDGRYKISDVRADNRYRPGAKVYDSNTDLRYDFLEVGGKLGVFVDLFPIDGISDSDFVNKMKFKKIRTIKALASAANHTYIDETEKHQKAKKLLRPIMRMIGAKRLTWYVEKNIATRKIEDSNYVGVYLSDFNYKKERFEKDLFEPMECDFCDTSFLIPKGYDRILRQLYGDYMQLPPVEKRVSHHIFKIYSLDKGE